MDNDRFRKRQRRFLAALPPDSVAVFPAAPAAVRSNDVEHPYRPDNDLLYLTGFPEPESAALLDNGDDAPLTLFVLPGDPERETWTGHRQGIEGACEIYGADESHEIGELEKIFTARLEGRVNLFVTFGGNDSWNQLVLRVVRRVQATRPRTGKPDIRITYPSGILHEMRLFKDADEIRTMRRAAEITAVAHREAFEAAHPGTNEREIEAIINFAFRRLGGSGPAYPSIVASGPNATILHHIENSRRMEDGDLLLIDAGAELEHYCADVTRTFPVGARFGPAQREVYEIVLEAQKRAVAAVRPGETVESIHELTLRCIVEGLISLGALSGSVDEAMESEAFRPHYMHRTSHWLGMDVHDVGRYRLDAAPRVLEPGMVLTIEPGLYFPNCTAAPSLEGIGVRIEDDVLVTEAGGENLTAAIPKEAADLERPG